MGTLKHDVMLYIGDHIVKYGGSKSGCYWSLDIRVSDVHVEAECKV